MTSILFTKIQFPEIQLQTRDAHKLRGYFGNLFKLHSELLHNHYESGDLRYRYPLVQYKVLDKTPTLIAIQEGATLLTGLFLKMNEIDIDGDVYPVHSKNIENKKVEIGYSEELKEYAFQTLWMGLNQANYRKYKESTEIEKSKLLSRILIGNILSFYKYVGLRLETHQKLLAKCQFTEKLTGFKGQNMLAFSGSFLVNADLPSGIGLGKGVSRGFGTVT
ncbi:MAG TPA: CRISPR-associated endonuclease Cas6 [Saprospiraceae bacterium]|nr:CRISPR-associated endonuclease Cas6 [Saprospiraceae bacterium]